MNTDFPSHLAKQLADNPSLFDASKDEMLAEYITAYVNGALSNENAAEVEALLKRNARAKTIHANILAANQFLSSEAGKNWLKEPVVRPEVAQVSGKILRFPSRATPHRGPHELQLAASSLGPAPIEIDRYAIKGMDLNLRLMTDRSGENIEIRVFTPEGTPSTQLDGAIFTWQNGASVVIQKGQALIRRPTESAEFRFTAHDGTVFELTEKK